MYPVIAVIVSLYSIESEVDIISGTFSYILTSHHRSSESSSSSNCEQLLDFKSNKETVQTQSK